MRASNYAHPSVFVTFLILLFAITPDSYSQDTRGIREVSRTASDSTLRPYSERYALIIGVDNYPDVSLQPLKYAVNDAEAIGNMLIDSFNFPRENVTILLNEEATRHNVLNSMQFYVESDSVSENSQFLFYFAGHGETIRNKIGYILPYDADPQNLVATGVRMSELRELADNLRPKHALFLMDACYGGLSTMRSTTPVTASFKNMLSDKGRHIITAGSANETVVEADEYQHSAFTYALLDALLDGSADYDKNGVITATDLAGKLQVDVAYYADIQGGKQTVQFTPLTPDPGQFMFIKNDSLAAEYLRNDDPVVIITDDDLTRKFDKSVIIRANVENAQVFINDTDKGYMPDNTMKLSLPVGVHKVVLKKDKFEDLDQLFVLTPADSARSIDLTLVTTHSRIFFDVEPTDAAVFIDSEYIGAGSFVAVIEKGRRRIEVSKEGYRPDIMTANVTSDSMSYPVTLTKIEGLLDLKTIPPGATVVDNRTDTLGTTPIAGYPLAYGLHSISLYKDGYRPIRETIEVLASEISSRTFEMRETSEVIARRTFNKKLGKHVLGFVAWGALAGGAYYGHLELSDYHDNLLEDDNQKQVAEIAKWGALGAVGLFSLTSVIQLFKLTTTRYGNVLNDQLRKELEESKALTFDVGIRPIGKRVGVHLALRY